MSAWAVYGGQSVMGEVEADHCVSRGARTTIYDVCHALPPSASIKACLVDGTNI